MPDSDNFEHLDESFGSASDEGVPIEPEAAEENEGVFRKAIRTYVLRAGRMTEGEKRNYADLHSVWCIPFEHKTLNYTEIFGNTNPVTVEIGFGMGHATSQIAYEHPDNNYIGIEVHKPGVGRLLSEIKNRPLKNIYIVEHDALEFLETMVPDNSVSAFHIFFPDPWPKKKHHKRRMLQRPRTDLLAKKLAKGGYLYFATDWGEYADSALEELTRTEGLVNKYESFAPHQEWRPRTKFEQKGINAGREIRELFFVKADK